MSDIRKGRFVWYDLMTTDPEGAKKFYGDVLGWGTQGWEEAPPDHDYVMFTNDGESFGGVNQLPEEAQAAGAPSHWLSYVAVPDCDAALAEVVKRGGTVLVPAMEVPTVGRFGVFSDPFGGAVLSAYTPAGDAPGCDDPPPGRMSWSELLTDDYEAAFDFYNALFGWEIMEDMDMGEAGVYRLFGVDGTMIGGMFNKPAEMPVAAWLYYVRVADLDATIEKATGAGAQLLNGPMDVPGGDRVAQLMDPQGAAVAFHWKNVEG